MLPPLTLVITTPGELVPPPLPTADGEHSTPWRDARGRLGALSHVVSEEPWLHVLNVASFRLELARGRVSAVAAPNAGPDAVEDEFRRTVIPAALQLQGWEVLHASAIRVEDGAVGFCGRSEAGKTTLAYALGRRGYPLWADDALILDVTPARVVVEPLPFAVRLRSASASFFGHERDTSVRGRVVRAGEDAVGRLPLTAVCMLQRVEGSDAKPILGVDLLTGPRAVASLLDHAVFFDFDDAVGKRSMIERYLAVANLVPVYSVAIRSGWDDFPAVLTGLEAHFGWRRP